MKEIFTKEEYREAMGLYNSQIKADFYENIDNYLPCEGYVDLKQYDMSDEDFKVLWMCQDFLSNYDVVKNHINPNIQNLCESIKNLYSNIFAVK